MRSAQALGGSSERGEAVCACIGSLADKGLLGREDVRAIVAQCCVGHGMGPSDVLERSRDVSLAAECAVRLASGAFAVKHPHGHCEMQHCLSRLVLPGWGRIPRSVSE